MYFFQSFKERDLYKGARDGDMCSIGEQKFAYSSDKGWREIISVISLERDFSDDDCCGTCEC